MTSHIRFLENPQEWSGTRLLLATFVLCFGTFLIMLSQFIGSAVVPSITGDLGASHEDGSWIATSYTAGKACSVLFSGLFISIFGRVRFFSYCAFLFALFSLFAGLATDYPTLIFFRSTGGFVSGPLIPISQLLLLFLYPNKKSFAFGLWGFSLVMGMTMGPFVGGWITYTYKWPWIFWINVPFGVLLCLALPLLLGEYEEKFKKIPIDTVGIALVLIVIGAYQIVLDKGNDADWWDSNLIIFFSIVVMIGLCFLVVWEHFHSHPVLDFSFFKHPNFATASLLQGFSMTFLFGAFTTGSNWAHDQLGYPESWAGYALVPFAIGTLISFPLTSLFLKLMDVRLWVAIGFFFNIIPLLYLAYLSIETPFANLAWPRFFQGLGFGMFFVPLTYISLAHVPQENMPRASSLFNFVRMIFISSGLSLTSVYFNRRENFFQSRYVESIIPSNPQYAPFFQALDTHLDLAGLPADALVNQFIMNQAFTETMLEILYLQGFGFVLLMGLLVFIKPKRMESS